MSPNVLADDERLFVAGARVGRLATSTTDGRPHVIPVCFELLGEDIYIGLDAKPKSVDLLKLRRVRNITSNPQAAFIVDRYSEDWSQLGYVLVAVDAVLVRDEVERSDATQALRRKYAQYQALLPADAPVIRLRPQRVTSWGALTPWEPSPPLEAEAFGSARDLVGGRGPAAADV
jgi:PPOX class probable F420-dependent enzyme